MSTVTINTDPATMSWVQSCIDSFAARGPRRSVILSLHEPFAFTWSVNPIIEHPAASLLKLPLVGALLIAGSHQEISLDQRIHPDRLDKTRYPSIRTGFSTSSITLLELSSLAIITSDNAAASYILNAIGADRYRTFLRAAGCERTGTPPGFNDEHFPLLQRVKTTAMDQNRILNFVWTIDSLHPLRLWMANNLRNSRLSARTDYPVVFAHKTGTLDGVAHDIGMLTTPNLRASMIALTSRESDAVSTSMEMADLGTELTDSLETLVLRNRP